MINNLIKILFLPIFLIIDVLKSKKSSPKTIAYIILIILLLGYVWFNAFNSLVSFAQISLFDIGITDRISKIKISGTSMLPALKDGSEVQLNSPKKYGITRGDIVTFQNIETGSASYIKRVIGLPGEKITIKNGLYFINGKALDEGYTLNNLPTYGNTFLLDCEEVVIPSGKYFVSGDNRTVSSDSRVIGLISKKDIEGVIKTKVGEKFLTSETQKNITQHKIDIEVFLKILNDKRVKDGKGKLATHTLLNQIADERAGQISKDFNGWKTSSIPLDKLLDLRGYRFNSVHEFVTFGYLNEEDIINQILEVQTEKDKFLGGDFTEVGIGVSERKYKDCTYPIISVILSWPSVPTYNQEDVESWVKAIDITNTLISNMQTWIGSGKDQQKIRQVISNAAEENQIAKRIYAKESTRQWLTSKDYQDIERYNASAKETEKLLTELFGPEVKGVSVKRNK